MFSNMPSPPFIPRFHQFLQPLLQFTHILHIAAADLGGVDSFGKIVPDDFARRQLAD